MNPAHILCAQLVDIMVKVLSTFGFLAGIGLLALAFLNAPSMRLSQAQEGVSGCRKIDVPTDEGYGISRLETRLICGRN